MHDVPAAAWISGRLVPWPEAVVPIEDRGLQFAESVYELLPVTGGRVRLAEPHLARMRAGAAELHLGDGVPEPSQLHEIASALAAREAVDEGLLYLQLTGGTAPRRHVPHPPPAPTLIAYLRRHRFPRDRDLARGYRTVTVPDPRWAQSDVKTTMLLPAVLARREAARQGADEALFVTPDGSVREGAASNVFAVVEGRLRTPQGSPHTLPGTMRALVLEAAGVLGLEVEAEELRLAELRGAEEAFVTATSILAMPVTAVDEAPIGAGGAGPATRRVAAWLRRHLGLDG